MDLDCYKEKGKIIDIQKGEQGYEAIFEDGIKTIFNMVQVESFVSMAYELRDAGIKISPHALMRMEKLIRNK